MLDRDNPTPRSIVVSSHSWQSLANQSPVALAHGLSQQGHWTSCAAVATMILLGQNKRKSRESLDYNKYRFE